MDTKRLKELEQENVEREDQKLYSYEQLQSPRAKLFGVPVDYEDPSTIFYSVDRFHGSIVSDYHLTIDRLRGGGFKELYETLSNFTAFQLFLLNNSAARKLDDKIKTIHPALSGMNELHTLNDKPIERQTEWAKLRQRGFLQEWTIKFFFVFLLHRDLVHFDSYFPLSSKRIAKEYFRQNVYGLIYGFGYKIWSFRLNPLLYETGSALVEELNRSNRDGRELMDKIRTMTDSNFALAIKFLALDKFREEKEKHLGPGYEEGYALIGPYFQTIADMCRIITFK